MFFKHRFHGIEFLKEFPFSWNLFLLTQDPSRSHQLAPILIRHLWMTSSSHFVHQLRCFVSMESEHRTNLVLVKPRNRTLSSVVLLIVWNFSFFSLTSPSIELLVDESLECLSGERKGAQFNDSKRSNDALGNHPLRDRILIFQVEVSLYSSKYIASSSSEPFRSRPYTGWLNVWSYEYHKS